MPDELVIVKTNVRPGFLDVCYAAEFPREQQERFAGFLDQIAEQYSAINIPILAITEQGVIVPDNINSGGGRMPLPSTAQDISELIDKYRVGDGTIYRGHTIPITAVVDFTNSKPELLGAYELLKQKYDVRELEVRDVA